MTMFMFFAISWNIICKTTLSIMETCIYLYVCLSISNIYLPVYVSVFLNMYVCMFVFVCVCMYVCMYACIYLSISLSIYLTFYFLSPKKVVKFLYFSPRKMVVNIKKYFYFLSPNGRKNKVFIFFPKKRP